MVITCLAALNIAGEHFCCDVQAPHAGLAHASESAAAVWCSDAEARAVGGNDERETE